VAPQRKCSHSASLEAIFTHLSNVERGPEPVPVWNRFSRFSRFSRLRSIWNRSSRFQSGTDPGAAREQRGDSLGGPHPPPLSGGEASTVPSAGRDRAGGGSGSRGAPGLGLTSGAGAGRARGSSPASEKSRAPCRDLRGGSSAR